MNETITLSRDTYDKLVDHSRRLEYLERCIADGYKTHAGDIERAVFSFEDVNGSFVVVAHAESEVISELNKINQSIWNQLNDQPVFKHLFGKLYIKQ